MNNQYFSKYNRQIILLLTTNDFICLNTKQTTSLSFRLWIPQVRGQPHGFSFSIQLDSRHPPRWAAGPPYCAWRRRSISFSVFLCSVVHLHLPPRSAWHNHPLLAVVRAHTISAWPPVPYPWYTLLQGCYWLLLFNTGKCVPTATYGRGQPVNNSELMIAAHLVSCHRLFWL